MFSQELAKKATVKSKAATSIKFQLIHMEQFDDSILSFNKSFFRFRYLCVCSLFHFLIFESSIT